MSQAKSPLMVTVISTCVFSEEDKVFSKIFSQKRFIERKKVSDRKKWSVVCDEVVLVAKKSCQTANGKIST